MSYEIVKSVALYPEKETIYITHASNNTSPRVFQKTEYGANISSYKEKVISLFVNILDGNLQIYRSCKAVYYIAETAFTILDAVSEKIDTLEYDLIHKTSYDRKVKELVAREYAYPTTLSRKDEAECYKSCYSKVEKMLEEMT